MQIVRNLPQPVARAFTTLPDEQGLGPFVGVAQVNTRNPDKVGQPAAVAAIGLGALSLGMSAGRMLSMGETHWIFMAVAGFATILAAIVVASVALGRAQAVGDEFVAVHEQGFVWAGSGKSAPRVFRYDSTTARRTQRANPYHKPDEAPGVLQGRFRDATQKLRIYASTPDDQAVLDTLLARTAAAAR